MTVPNTEEWRYLFEKYREYFILWQINNEHYKNKFLRNAKWKDLLEIYKTIEKNATVENLKRKMQNIKSCYRRELKKVLESERSGAGIDDIYVPLLWYFENLDFLRDQETPIQGSSTICDEIDENENLVCFLFIFIFSYLFIY